MDASQSFPNSLQTFTLAELAQFTNTGCYASDASPDFHLFYVGQDNVHEALKYVIERVCISLHLNQFGYDDDELNDLIWQKVEDPNVLVMITLDKSQAGGVHEKKLLDRDRQQSLADFNTHFVVGQSATHQISHTKGFVADGRVGAEGSTNWSASGEGIFVVKGKPGGPGFVAQNNTQSFFTCPATIREFQARLIAEHMVAQAQSV